MTVTKLRCLPHHRLFKDFHSFRFGLCGDVDIWPHSLIVRVAGPFHYDLWGNAAGEGEADEGAAAGVGADQLPFGVGLADSLSAAEIDTGYGFVEPAQFTQFLQVAVHPLVADDRKRKSFREVAVLIFLNDFFGEGVEVDGNTVVGLLRGDVQIAVVDVCASYLRHIRVPQGCEGAEAEKVAGLDERLAAFDRLCVPPSFEVAKVDDCPSGWDREVI